MKTAKLASALFILLATSTASWAAATAEEAAKIQASFQSYLGAEPGVIAVVPAGDGYDITVDANPYLKKIPEPGFTGKLDPFKMTATPQGNGLWAVKSSGPYNAVFDMPNAFSFSMQAQSMDWSGTYSEAIFAFTESSYNITNLAISQRTTDPQSKMVTNQATVIGSMAGKGTSTDKGNGLADSEGTATFANIVSSTTLDIPADAQAAGMPNLNYVANLAKGGYTSSIKDMNAKAIMDVVAFFVARPSKELIIKDQALMKEKLLAALPMFQNISSDGTFENMTLDTGLGQFALAGGGSYIAMNGAVKEGRFGEGFSFSGLKTPDSLPLPPWSKGLVPTSFKMGFDLSDFDAEAPARKFITEMDVTKPDPVPPGSEMAYLAAFAPKNALTLTIPPGEIAADLYSLTYEGVSNISLAGGLPTVSAKIRLTGMDKVIAQLQQAAADPMAQQGMAMLFAFKGIGKAEGDTTIWDVTFGADNKLMVNGTDVSAMLGALGGPPPQAPAQ
jgi:hypothetical protein